MKRLRLAFFTPLSPQRTGISVYSEELLPFLGELADIDVVIGDYTPSNREITGRFDVIGTDEFRKRGGEYDACVYQIGNNLDYHGYMVPCMRDYPGIAVLHDYSLSYLILGLTLLKGDLRTLRRVLDRSPNSAGSSVTALKLLLSRVDPYEVSLVAPIVDMSRAVIVHSGYANELLRRDFPSKPSAVVRMGIPVPGADGPKGEELKKRYGLTDADFVLMSVSNLSYNKRIPMVLKALSEVKERFPKIRYVLASGGTLGAEVKRLIRDYGLEENVVLTGWLSDDEYGEMIGIADAVIDMRYPTAGETSASVLRAMAAGKPLVLSAHGFFLEVPDSCAIKIEVGGKDETARVAGAVEALAGDEKRRKVMSRAAREEVAENNRLEDTAASYASFIREAVGLEEEPPAVSWFDSGGASAVESLLVSSAYKVFRTGYLYRHYGLQNLLRRLRRELGPGG